VLSRQSVTWSAEDDVGVLEPKGRDEEEDEEQRAVDDGVPAEGETEPKIGSENGNGTGAEGVGEETTEGGDKGGDDAEPLEGAAPVKRRRGKGRAGRRRGGPSAVEAGVAEEDVFGELADAAPPGKGARGVRKGKGKKGKAKKSASSSQKSAPLGR